MIALLILQTAAGAGLGWMLGVAVAFLRYLATLPGILRRRAERSARANSQILTPEARRLLPPNGLTC